MMRHSKENSAGFSLLELLLAIAVLGMISVALVSVMGTGRRIWERTDETSVRETALARSRLRSLVESIPLPTDQGSVPIVFSGNPFEMTFLSFPPDSMFWAGQPMSIKVRKRESEAGVVLEFLETGLTHAERKSFQIIRRFPLVFSQVDFSFFGSMPADGRRKWHMDWTNATLLPELIKIVLVDENGVTRPPLIIRPAILARQKVISISSPVPPT